MLIASANTLVGFVHAQDWPALRGADGNGIAATVDGTLSSSTASTQFETRWKKKLGSGYSSVVVANQQVVVMFTDGEKDLVRCLNAADGATIWDFELGPMFVGENGSFDGPLSTPVVHDNKVFSLSATGKLFCLSLDNGEKVWSRNLAKEMEVDQPLYGFVTSPIVTDETLIVQIGAKEKSTVGIDLATGETKWTAGDNRISSQSPAVIEIDGRKLLLTTGHRKLTGLDPEDGSILFEFEHEGGNGSAMIPVLIGQENDSATVLLTLDDKFSKAVTISLDGEEFSAEEKWQERSIKNTYNIPVFDNGNVFAYSTRILTCVDPETGQPHWKTRNPGDGFLISVDGHLIISTKKGSLHLARSSSGEYEELAELKLFEDLVWSVPAYSDNSVFVRSLGEIARVDLVSSESIASETKQNNQAVGPKFQSFLAEVNQLNDETAKSKLIDQWIDSNESFPVVEDDLAYFIYRGDEPDVALAGDFLGARQEAPMTKLVGTDFHYYAMKFPADQRVNYCFLVNFKPQLDALNSKEMTSTMYAGEMEFAVRLRGQEPLKMSWFGMPKWKQPDYLTDNGQGEPTLITHTLEPEAKEDEPKEEEPESDDSTEDEPADPSDKAGPPPITFQIQTPPGYDADGDQKYPVAYMFDGDSALQHGEMATSLHRLFQSDDVQAQPSIVVYLRGMGPDFMAAVSEKIVPFVDQQYKTIADRKSRLVISFGFAGEAALMTVASNNKLFANAAVQSPLSFADSQRAIAEATKTIELPTTVHLQWGRYDMFNPHENWDLRDISQSLVDEIKKNEQITVVGGMVNDTTDWSSWKNRYEEILGLLGKQE